MTDTWKSIFKGTIEERLVKIEIYTIKVGIEFIPSRVADYPGKFISKDNLMFDNPHSEQGCQINIEENQPMYFVTNCFRKVLAIKSRLIVVNLAAKYDIKINYGG